MRHNINKLDNEQILDKDKGFINYNAKQYFFKKCKEDLCYREIIAYEIAAFLNIPSVFYSLALIPSKNNKTVLGVISLDYKDENLSYISGHTILKDYYQDYMGRWHKSDYTNNWDYNALDSIWSALDHRYRYEEDRIKIVKNLFNEIIRNIFLFDIFTKNADRHYHNWEITEDLLTDEKKINLLYDNEDIFLGKRPVMCNIICSTGNRGNNNWYDLLREFLKESDKEYLKMVQDIFERLTPNALVNLIHFAEIRHSINIPLQTKQDIITKYTEHYEKIGQVLSEFDRGVKRILIL